MATPVESHGPVEPAPAHIKNEQGTSILPTQQLPGVDFGAHLRKDQDVDRTNTTTADVDSPAPAPIPRESAESYFVAKPGEGDDVNAIKKSNTEQFQEHVSRSTSRPVQRVQTAPASRPNPLQRTSTLAKSLMRRPTNDPYSYTFDPMSSDSDTSSSEEEEEDESVPEQEPKRQQVSRAQTAGQLGEHKHTPRRARRGQSYSKFRIGNEHFRTKGKVSRQDGRLNLSINETANTGYLAKALGHTIKHHLDIPNQQRPRKQRQHAADHPDAKTDADSIAESLHKTAQIPRLNIVIIVIGSRGDIQPFLKIGKILKEEHGHRVRIATHPTFRDFVEKETQLEFFSVGGDPSELMAFMVKNPGLVPNLQTVREGEIHKRRAAMGEMFEGMWRACTNATENETNTSNLKMMGSTFPFVADAIIANPPSMAHVHIAERLGVPLHIMFTFPYSPTQQFPHPLANIKPGKSNVDTSYVNFMSYPLVEMMTWQGLGDIVNKFRQKVLGLEPVSSLWAPGALYRMKVPYTYMWSPSLVPKPNDWGPEIDVTGFVFMQLADNFKPDKELSDFLDAGEPPVYIGFGSIVVDDPNKFTEMIFEATKIAGVRALVNKGWGGLGKGNDDTPDNIFMLGNTPHDWLFPKVKAVVHHGGAGTTAAGLKYAKPTMIVPFFGDQPFWGARVSEAKAGAHFCIPWKKLTAEKLAEGIKQCLTEEAQTNVQKMADGIEAEGDGAMNACESFHRSLPLAGRFNQRCSILEDRVAVWTLRGSTMRLSSLAAEILLQKGKIKTHDLKLFRALPYNDFDGPGEPITGVAGAVTDSLYGIGSGVGMVPVRVAQHMRKRAEHERRKQQRLARKEKRREEKQQRDATQSATARDNGLHRPTTRREDTTHTQASAFSADPTTPLGMEVARDIGNGFKRSGTALLTMPNDLLVAIAQGFHNAPRLWGDATVRKPIRIVGAKTGFEAAGKEFTYGIYDAWTGLVTQPAGGFKDGDTIPAKISGLGTGFAKGIGSFVLKNVSAVVAPPAYAGKGLIVYLKKRAEKDGPGSKAYLRKARIIQGHLDLEALQKQDNQDKDEQIRQIFARVTEGYKVYEEIWKYGHREFGAYGSDVVGKLKFRREKKRWAESGALENIHAAEKALEAHKKGNDVERQFSKRREEFEDADRPKRSAMQPDAGKVEKRNVLPEANKLNLTDTTYAAMQAEKNVKLGREAREAEEEPAKDSEEEEDDSETAVASSEDGNEKHDSSAVPATTGDGDLAKKIGGERAAEYSRVTMT